jgi:hypothetical protein
MLLTNETLLLLQVGLSSNDDKYMSCIVNMQWWLITHYMAMCLIHLILLMSYLWITCVSTTIYLFSSSFRNLISIIEESIQVRSYEDEERYFYWIIMMMKEITLIIAYSLLAFFFKFFGFVNNDSSITQMNVCRWFIEASFFSFLFVSCFCIYYVRCMYDIFDEYQTVYMIIIMLKVPLFFWMRYAEYELDAFPNKLEAYIQSATCKVISERENLEIF